MKKALLIGIAALFLATGTVHAQDQLPKEMLGRWCEANLIGSMARKLYFRPSFIGRQHGCVDFDDGITISEGGFSDDRPIDYCYDYVFDKIERLQDGAYLVSARCEKPPGTSDPDQDLGGTWQLQIVHDDLLIFTRASEG